MKGERLTAYICLAVGIFFAFVAYFNRPDTSEEFFLGLFVLGLALVFGGGYGLAETKHRDSN